jgi:hypothetical protein
VPITYERDDERRLITVTAAEPYSAIQSCFIPPWSGVLNRRLHFPMVAALCAFMAACGANSPTPSSSPTQTFASSYDGQWSGTTSQGMQIAFSVVNQRVTAITFGYVFEGCSGVKTLSDLNLLILFSPNSIAPAGRLAFVYVYPPVGQSDPSGGSNFTDLIGSFASSATATGRVVFGGYSCGTPEVGLISLGGFTWTAVRL